MTDRLKAETEFNPNVCGQLQLQSILFSIFSIAGHPVRRQGRTYRVDDFKLGVPDVKLGVFGDAEVYISGSQFEAWKHTQLVLDVVPGRSGMFSLDNGREKRFFTRGSVFLSMNWQRLKL